MTTAATADAGHLVLGLLMEESLGSKCLNELGVTIAGIADGCFGQAAADTAMTAIDSRSVIDDVLPFQPVDESLNSTTQPTWCDKIVDRARWIAKRAEGDGELSSEHLLMAMVQVDSPVQALLAGVGVDTQKVNFELNGESPCESTLPVDFTLNIESALAADVDDAAAVESLDVPTTDLADSTSATQSAEHGDRIQDRVLTLIDANLNRSREGLRVLEDFARFVIRDPAVTKELKTLRHELVATERTLRTKIQSMINSRDVAADVGTKVTTAAEMHRGDVTDVVTANARRVQESLRSLEEFGKTVSAEFAADIKQLRYRSYIVEQALVTQQQDSSMVTTSSLKQQRLEKLEAARLYVLVTEAACRLPWQDVVTAALEGGADVIQLREKDLPKDEIVRRGRWIAQQCANSGALFILNDDAATAMEAQADGVHIGQEDGTLSEARQLLNPDQLIGLSTHNVQQVELACRDKADYLGIGPVFPSLTKTFSDFPGVNFVAQAMDVADRPCFAIGGISANNVAEVISAGATRVAVSTAVIAAKTPEESAGELRSYFEDSDDAEIVEFRRS